MAQIKPLSASLIERIAAGEVVERPANVVKELVENALDAGATQIAIHIRDGGKTHIEVRDNGCGIPKDELPLAVSRHATSKLNFADAGADGLFQVETLGFRGEALAAIGAVARLVLTSRHQHADRAHTIAVSGGKVSALTPAAGPIGTRVSARDLFFATPARRKFLKSERAEALAVSDVVRNLALARPDVGFRFFNDGKPRLQLPPQAEDLAERMRAVMGQQFLDNMQPLEAGNDTMRLTGYASVPTFHHASSKWQYFIVNGRVVRDRLVYGSLRAAYHDYLVSGRHPAVLLCLEVPPDEVDVNVHPTKAEVRFRDAAQVRSLIVGGVRQALHAAGHRASSTNADAALAAMRIGGGGGGGHRSAPDFAQKPIGFAEERAPDLSPDAPLYPDITDTEPPPQQKDDNEAAAELPLGLARAQVHDTYIVAQTGDGLVIVDQHAAHERLVYERIKAALAQSGVPRQMLLVPEVVELAAEDTERLLEAASELAQLGLVIEPFGEAAIVVRATPAMLGAMDVKACLADLADEFGATGKSFSLKEHLEATCGTFACHTSIRAGHQLNLHQMDGLLRQMEATPHSGQCNHGRPTYVELKLKDIERLFGRR